jgi:hypothetical protein
MLPERVRVIENRYRGVVREMKNESMILPSFVLREMR